jgi:alkanesulfonate monooxygenase SsuD/methylene tetrahydromethanopterin reductase-like flavin-dependent oxidoreductase (luciferase family)
MSALRGGPAPTEEGFLREVGSSGALYVGSPETVAQKITETLRVVGATRFDLNYAPGGVSHGRVLTSIHLYGSSVIPRVRALMPPAQGPGADPPRT